MPGKLTKADYKKIIDYYHLPVPKTNAGLKKSAEDIIALKLCRCIKKVEPNNEAKSIGICTRNVINKKGFTRGAFTCKNKRTIQLGKRQTRAKRRNK